MKSEDEVNMLKGEADAVKSELDAINKRIEELEAQSSEEECGAKFMPGSPGKYRVLFFLEARHTWWEYRRRFQMQAVWTQSLRQR